MKGILLTLVFVLLPVLVHGDETRPPEVPDPSGLSADWWSYFEPRVANDPEVLKNRLAAAREQYNALQKKLRVGKDVRARKDLEEIISGIDRLQEPGNAPVTVMDPPATPPDRYTLDEALNRFEAWWKLKLQVEAESEEITWWTTVLDEQRKQQTRMRGRYLDMDAQSTQRLAAGLNLMRTRIFLELQSIELDRRKGRLKQTREKLDYLLAELERIPGHLIATPEEIPRRKAEYHEAQQLLEKFRGDAGQGVFLESRPDEVLEDLFSPQYTALVAVRKDIEVHVHELKAFRKKIALSLTQLIVDESEIDGESVRTRIGEIDQLNKVFDKQRDRWKQVIERVQGVLSGSVAVLLETDKQRVRTSLQKELERAGQLMRSLQYERAASKFVARLLSARLRTSEGWLDQGWKNISGSIVKTGASGMEYFRATLFEINETPVTVLGLLRVALILTIALWVSRILRRTIQRVGERRGGVSQSSLYTFGRLLHYLILMIGVIIGLSSVGIDFTKFALFASALGIGIGFGLQTLISNFVAGLIILFEKSLKVSDFVELESGVAGEVKEINMRSTLISTNDNVDILVPNSEFVGGRVTNWTLREAYRRVHIPFGVAYGTDKDKVKKAALEAAENVPWTLKKIKNRNPQVWLVEFGDSSLNFELVVWLTPEAVKRPGAVSAAYLWEIESRLHEHGIEIPFPQRDLHVRSVFGLKDENARNVFRPDPV